MEEDTDHALEFHDRGAAIDPYDGAWVPKYGDHGKGFQPGRQVQGDARQLGKEPLGKDTRQEGLWERSGEGGREIRILFRTPTPSRRKIYVGFLFP